ncbi:MAG: hypothetical protein ACYDED_09830 [Ferrimicrobium sp.]
MLHRLLSAMVWADRTLPHGKVEVDETLAYDDLAKIRRPKGSGKSTDTTKQPATRTPAAGDYW